MKKRSKKSRRVQIPRLRLGRLFAYRLKRERDSSSMDYEQESGVPRITNNTVAEHREEVLASARKYIYPLQHSKHRVVVISSVLFGLTVVIFFAYVLLSLYKFHSTSTFTYRITQVLPFPVAKTDAGFVSYESYLFELRHYLHYYESQQKVNFDDKSGKEQLESFRTRSLNQVVNRAYVKKLAKQNGVSVSNKEVDRTLNLLRSQNRLGSSDQVFQDVLKEYWGWSIDDFKRELTSEILEQKVASKLDTAASQKAAAAQAAAANGTDFAEVVKKYSEDEASKSTGGEYGFAIKKTNRDVSPQVIETLFHLKPGEVSEVLNTGVALEVNKVISSTDGQVKAAHVVIGLKPISAFVDPLVKKGGVRYFVSYKELPSGALQ